MGVSLIYLMLILAVTGADQSCETENIENVVCSLCAQRKGHDIADKRVAFYAYISKNVPITSLVSKATFVYDSVETNIGNAYNRETGNFTVPYGGVYAFHVTTVSFDSSWSTVQLMVNGVMKDVGFADSGNHIDRDTASTFTILTLKKGDVVYTRNNLKGGKYLESNQHSRLSFSGFKIY